MNFFDPLKAQVALCHHHSCLALPFYVEEAGTALPTATTHGELPHFNLRLYSLLAKATVLGLSTSRFEHPHLPVPFPCRGGPQPRSIRFPQLVGGKQGHPSREPTQCSSLPSNTEREPPRQIISPSRPCLGVLVGEDQLPGALWQDGSIHTYSLCLTDQHLKVERIDNPTLPSHPVMGGTVSTPTPGPKAYDFRLTSWRLTLPTPRPTTTLPTPIPA